MTWMMIAKKYMKYLTQNLKDKLSSSLGLSYVIEGEEGHNRIKQEDGSFKDLETKLIVGDIIPQNDLITLNFNAENSEEITISGDELRALGEELIEWADIIEETL